MTPKRSIKYVKELKAMLAEEEDILRPILDMIADGGMIVTGCPTVTIGG